MNKIAMITGSSGILARSVASKSHHSGWQLALVSAEAGWITGQVLPVDDGFSAVRPLQKAV